MMRSCSGLTFMLCAPSVVKMEVRRISEDAHAGVSTRCRTTANYMAAAGSVKRGVLSWRAGGQEVAGRQSCLASLPS